MLPPIAPSGPSSAPPRAGGVADLNTLTPAGSLRAGNQSWVATLGVAVVAEALLLWLAGWIVTRREGFALRFVRRHPEDRREDPSAGGRRGSADRTVRSPRPARPVDGRRAAGSRPGGPGVSARNLAGTASDPVATRRTAMISRPADTIRSSGPVRYAPPHPAADGGRRSADTPALGPEALPEHPDTMGDAP